MANKHQGPVGNELAGIVIDERITFTLHEFCHVCGVHTELVLEMVDEGVIEPSGTQPEEWIFPGRALLRAQTALRLVHDLRLNWPGAALALDLLEDLDRLG